MMLSVFFCTSIRRHTICALVTGVQTCALPIFGDESLRADLRKQVARLHAKRTFGLVFESHQPERVRLPEHPLRPGLTVAYRDDPDSPGFEVVAIKRKRSGERRVGTEWVSKCITRWHA